MHQALISMTSPRAGAGGAAPAHAVLPVPRAALLGMASGGELGGEPPGLQHGWRWSPGLSRRKGDSFLVCD